MRVRVTVTVTIIVTVTVTVALSHASRSGGASARHQYCAEAGECVNPVGRSEMVLRPSEHLGRSHAILERAHALVRAVDDGAV